MVKISILYPHTPGTRFNIEYYLRTHMAMSIGLLRVHPGFRGVSVERGTAGGPPGSPPHFVAMCHYLFASADDFLAAFVPHAERLQGDMANYTDVMPLIQISTVEISEGVDVPTDER